MLKLFKIVNSTLMAAGIAGILAAIIVSPEFAQNYLSADHVITPERFDVLQMLRWSALFVGCIMLASGAVMIKFTEETRDFMSRPSGTVLTLVLGWILIVFLNYILKQVGLKLGTPDFFPFSEFYGPRIILSGLPYSVLFLLTLFVSVKYCNNFNMLYVWIAGLALIILGNLAQGSMEASFYKPFNAPFEYEGILYYEQYYHDAIKITDWREWLNSFNVNQVNLLMHTRTHPPFAILLHYFFMKLSNNHMLFLSGSFVLLSSLSICIVFRIMNVLGLTKQQCVRIALLFAVIPVYNIYSAVSLDGVIVSFAALFLLGLVMTVMRGISLSGTVLFIAGLFLANLHTFLALFLIGTAGMVALQQLAFHRKYDVLMALAIFLLLMICVHFYISYYYGYSHVQAFLTASALEPKSVLFTNPLVYVTTRLENVTMMAIFLSFGISAVLLRSSFLNLRIFDWRDDINAIFIAGILPLFLFLLIGGLYTGEIARICLFLYPFFLLMLRKVEESILRFILIAAGIQTAIMQTFGGYYW